MTGLISGEIFAVIDAWFMALALAMAMFAAWGAGLWMGRQVRERNKALSGTKIDDASLALVSLLLAFTFGMSMLKHDNRRLMVVADSNAIGDFYTCASLIKEPMRTKLQVIIRDYAKLRLEVARQRFPHEAFEEALRQFQRMQGQMTVLVRDAVDNGTPIAVSLTNTLNTVTSNHAARLAAIRDRLPASIVLLLLASAIVSIFLVGREQGASDSVEVLGTICFIVLVALAIYVTLDLNQPDRGLITVSQEPMRRLLSSMPK